MILHVYAPKEPERSDLPRGSAILGSGRSNQLILVGPQDRYERFADTCRRGEETRRFKSVEIDLEELVLVGYWDSSSGELRLTPWGAAPLQVWIGRPVHRGELEAADSRHNVRQQARMKARRYDMQGRPDLAARERSRHNIGYW